MENRLYKYRYSNKKIVLSIIYIAVIIAAITFVCIFYPNSYIVTLCLPIAAALFTLIMLSMPRRVVLSEQMLTIYCLLKVVEIPLDEIVSVREVSKSEMRWITPLLSSFGLFGYFGYYINLQSFEVCRIYASEWNNIIEIVNSYDDHFYICCQDSSSLLEELLD